jgi:ABC-type antimicrobial peptide transport system permease subunit
MTYALHKKLGDIIEVEGVRLRLVAALEDSIFQGELLVAGSNFVRAFPGIEGYRYFLLEGPEERSGPLEQALSDYGFDVVRTQQRLAEFHRVENTYLSTFQSLGALGLLLGTAGMGAILLRNVLERRRELALLRAVGYRPGHLKSMILGENALIVLMGLVTGIVCAVPAVAPAKLLHGGGLPVITLAVLPVLVFATGLGVSLVAAAVALRMPLVADLKAE